MSSTRKAHNIIVCEICASIPLIRASLQGIYYKLSELLFLSLGG